MADTKKSGRGFAVMPLERVRQIATMGGQASQRSGRAHKFTSEEAREAGRKGGLAKKSRKTQEPTTDA